MEPERKRWPRWWWLVAAAALVLPLLGYASYRLWFAPPTQVQIDNALAQADWQRAARLLQRADLASDRGMNHYSLGVAHMNIGNDEEAIRAYMRADDLEYRRGDARFAIATLYARRDDHEMALMWLRDALEIGVSDPTLLDTEAAFDAIRGTPEWLSVVDPEGDDDASSPKGLDFLLGTWNMSRGGFGTSTVTFSMLIEGRAVLESWTGTAPDGASGMYLYDPATSHWTYSFVDGYGRIFRGNVRTGRQVTITGKLTFMDGTEVLRRIEIRAASGVVDYVVTDSRNGGRTWDAPDQRRLTAVTSGPRPSF